MFARVIGIVGGLFLAIVTTEAFHPGQMHTVLTALHLA